MADISLYLNNVYSSKKEQDETDTEQTSDLSNDDFVCVDLGAMGTRKQRQKKAWERVPRRIIHFSSGETMEEFSTDEEDDDESETEPPSPKHLCAYIWFYFLKGPAFLYSVVLYLGERFAALFDITTGKYQYAIDTYYRLKEKERQKRFKELELEESLAIVPEESERYSEQSQSHEDRDEPPLKPHIEWEEPLKVHIDRDDLLQSLEGLDEQLALADVASPHRVTYRMEDDTKGLSFPLQGLSEPHRAV